MRVIGLLSVAGLMLAGCASVQGPTVALRTSQGDIVVALEIERAPVTTATS